MYAFVDVADYQKVVVSDASNGIAYAAYNYLNNNGIILKGMDTEIIIKEIKTVIIDGNTYYYIVDTNDEKYRVSIKINSNKLPFIKTGDKLVISYNNKGIKEIISVK